MYKRREPVSRRRATTRVVARKQLDKLSIKLQIRTTEDWHNISIQDLQQHKAEKLAKRFNYSLERLFSAAYPEFTWNHWDFKNQTSFLDDTTLKKTRAKLDWIAERLNVRKSEDWYGVTLSMFKEHGGSALVCFENSLSLAIQSVYSEYEWFPWLFEHCPKNFWTSEKNQKRYLMWLSEQFEIEQPEQWHDISNETLQSTGGTRILKEHPGMSIVSIVQAVWPEMYPRRVSQTKDLRHTFNDISNKLGIEVSEDWYGMDTQDVLSVDGGEVLKLFGMSIRRALQQVYPEFVWYPWLLEKPWSNYWKKPQHQRQYFDWLTESLGIQTLNDWYKFTNEDIRTRFGADFLREFDNSLLKVLQHFHPEQSWYPWLFASVPRNFWLVKHQREYFDWLGEYRGVDTFEKWYELSPYDVKETGGGGFLGMYYNGSLSKALCQVYPEFLWIPWLFTESRNHPSPVHNKEVFDWLAERLSIETSEDWYRVTSLDLQASASGNTKSSIVASSLYKSLKSVYPQFLWYPWLFDRSHKNIWTDEQNRREYVEWLAEQLGLEHPQEWQKVALKNVTEKNRKGQRKTKFLCSYNGATLKVSSGFLFIYGGSFSRAVRELYPDLEFSMFSTEKSKREQLDKVAEELRITKTDDWYSVSTKALAKHGGAKLLEYYGGSICKALCSVFPEFEWLEWKFEHSPRRFWDNDDNQRKFFDWLADELDIQSPEDWYQLSNSVIRAHGGTLLIEKHGGFLESLQYVYPQYEWKEWSELHISKSEGQAHVMKLIAKVTKSKVLSNYKHPLLFYPESKVKIELDLYIPSLEIAFEYQGLQHYSQSHRGSFQQQVERDELKRKICADIGITLIEVPYWWDLSPASLITTIAKHRPDIKLYYPSEYQSTEPSDNVLTESLE